MSVLTVGRRVHYVMRNGQCRPLDVVKVISAEKGELNGTVLLDGEDDINNLPWLDNPNILMWRVTQVKEHTKENHAGTWHWPEKEGE